MVEKAAASSAEQVILDLEDACAPSEKADARGAAADALRDIDFRGKTRSVRINDVTTPWCYRDIVELVTRAGAELDVLVLPKVEDVSYVSFVNHLLSGLEQDIGLERRIGLDVLIETVRGALNVREIAFASDRIHAIVFGPGDYAASLGLAQLRIGGIEREYPGHQWHWVMSQIAACGHAVGAQPIDGAYGDFRDERGFRESAAYGKLLGFTGKWCIHPNQLPWANEVFTPTAAEVDAARRLLQAYGEATRAGRGAIGVDGTLIDEASRKLAEGTLARATPAQASTSSQ